MTAEQGRQPSALHGVFAGVKFHTSYEGLDSPLTTVGICFDLAQKNELAAELRHSLRALWNVEATERASIVYSHEQGKLYLQFHVLTSDKHTLDMRLASIRRFLYPNVHDNEKQAFQEQSYIKALSQGDTLYTFRDLADYHILDGVAGPYVKVPPRPKLIKAEALRGLLTSSPVTVVCYNGNEERCRYIIRSLWPDGRRQQSPDKRSLVAHAPSSAIDYRWKRCKEDNNISYVNKTWAFDGHDEELVATLTALLLGGGYTFCSGGPGKGLFSRYQEKILPMDGVQSATGIMHGNRIGFELSCQAGGASKIARKCEGLLYSLADKGPTQQEFSRSKNKLLFILNDYDPLLLLREKSSELFGETKKFGTNSKEQVRALSRYDYQGHVTSILNRRSLRLSLGG